MCHLPHSPPGLLCWRGKTPVQQQSLNTRASSVTGVVAAVTPETAEVIPRAGEDKIFLNPPPQLVWLLHSGREPGTAFTYSLLGDLGTGSRGGWSRTRRIQA